MRPVLYTLASLAGHALAAGLVRRIPQQFSYAAFGDSFSAGIGAGEFFTGSADNQDNACARMKDSYPNQIVEARSLKGNAPHFDFLACSGDVLDDIDGQVSKLLGNLVDVASVSISGNESNFGNVVRDSQPLFYYKFNLNLNLNLLSRGGDHVE
ncbi:hypothetical protein B0A55_00387 [Friedmanniomyces simplex]|uniref:SGNH hydrolase-type esterase domain-containing protein n=1 Tax=Friedmanniomyces simplex TaxID=329884 RepID=A0A4U0Y7F8_9PEZI|nr:hypothetical protein B0A55_00387 [Friedmanniomyces simplex]